MRCQLGLHLMTEEHSYSYDKYFLTRFCFDIISTMRIFELNAFAMGASQGFCNNEYDGPIINATINVGNQTTRCLLVKQNTTQLHAVQILQ